MAFDVYPEKLQSYDASGDLPDLFEMSFAWFPEWVKLGWPENLDAAIKRDRINLADYDRTVIGMGRWPYLKGPSYSWWTMMGVGTFYYNKAMFDREGLRYPGAGWTWEEALEVAKRLTRPGQQWGLQLASYTDGLIYAYGGQVFNEEGTKCLLDSPESIRAHQFWADLFLKHRVSVTSAELRDAGAQGDPFAAGKIGMYLHGSYPVGQFRRDVKDFQWEIAPSPAGPAGRAVSVAGNPSHAVAAAGRQKERAWNKVWGDTRAGITSGSTPVEQVPREATHEIDRILQG